MPEECAVESEELSRLCVTDRSGLSIIRTNAPFSYIFNCRCILATASLKNSFFYLANTIPEECAVESEDKVACESQNEADCTAEGCCWEDDPGYPYCYEKRSGKVQFEKFFFYL